MKKMELELARLLEGVNENEHRSLSEIATQQVLIEDEIQRLRSMKLGRPTKIGFEREVFPSQFAGVDEIWMRWLEVEIRAKISDLAKVKAAFEDQRQCCLYSIGRKTAFKKMVARQTLTAKLAKY